MLERLIYVSTGQAALPLSGVKRIVGRAQIRNRQLDVTGMLVFARPEFVQVLEGRPEALNELFGHIVNDTRHGDVRVLERCPVSTRRFERWSMELLVTDVLAERLAQLKAGEATMDELIDAMLVETQLL